MKIVIKNTTFLLISIMTFVILSQSNVMAASKKDVAIKAYKKILSKTTVKLNSGDYKNKQLNTNDFALVDIDRNGVPELIVADYSLFALYTCKNGKAKQILADADWQGSGWWYYKGAKELHYCPSSVVSWQMDVFLKVKKGKARREYIAEDGIQGRYFYNTSRISRIEYERYHRRLELITSEGKVVKTYRNTVANRKKIKKLKYLVDKWW